MLQNYSLQLAILGSPVLEIWLMNNELKIMNNEQYIGNEQITLIVIIQPNKNFFLSMLQFALDVRTRSMVLKISMHLPATYPLRYFDLVLCLAL